MLTKPYRIVIIVTNFALILQVAFFFFSLIRYTKYIWFRISEWKGIQVSRGFEPAMFSGNHLTELKTPGKKNTKTGSRKPTIRF